MLFSDGRIGKGEDNASISLKLSPTGDGEFVTKRLLTALLFFKLIRFNSGRNNQPQVRLGSEGHDCYYPISNR